MSGWTFRTPVVINGESLLPALVDSGSNSFALIDDHTAQTLSLERLPIIPRPLHGVASNATLTSVVKLSSLDISGAKTHDVFAYVVPNQKEKLILGTPWIQKEQAFLSPDGKFVELKRGKERYLVRPSKWYQSQDTPKGTAGAVMGAIIRRSEKNQQKGSTPTVFAASVLDIEKALQVKSKTDPKTKVPKSYWDHLGAFEEKETSLPPHRPGIDMEIKLETDENGREKPPPWGPLYSMSRDELLVLRKTLLEHVDKGYIRASKSPAAAPVLFAKKPGGGLRFCVDYRGINGITIRDRYPLPLIQETLRQVSQADWVTKLDVRAAFHRIRVQKGDEWKTAFNTRYGLFEWQVVPFGLCNGPSVFQRYINFVLRDLLDNCASAYVDDVLVYSKGPLNHHRDQVKQVLARLEKAGLCLDVDKCEFEAKKTKYLGFIIEVGKGIAMDPAKVEAVSSWAQPKTVKGVRSFLGFANFYRMFIPQFATLAAPLVALTKKGQTFHWGETEKKAFEELKAEFLTTDSLAGWNPDAEPNDTVVETDASGYAIGGRLLQKGKPVAFYSRKMTSAERNYNIHDKELLGVVSCCKEWYHLLRALPGFLLITDHKNLTYFHQKQLLNERQIRWSEFLQTLPPFTVQHKPGKQNFAADALSRKEEDEPKNPGEGRVFKLWQWPLESVHSNAACALGETPPPPNVFENDELNALWREGVLQDQNLQQGLKAVQTQNSSLWPGNWKAQFSDCDQDGEWLTCRGKLWVPEFEPLRTAILQQSHDSPTTGHLGRDALIEVVRRRFFWPGLNNDARRFVRNCDVCGRGKVWRQKRQGILQPLPIPQRQWQHISMDFMGPLPTTERQQQHIMVLTDRLSGNLILRALPDIQTTTVTHAFLDAFYGHHGPPKSIVSDRGPQFISGFWARFCKMLGIDRKLTTAYHPQANGGTERANQDIQAYLRAYCNFHQTDWDTLLPAAMLGLNNRPSITRGGVSPFFASHGFDVDPIQMAHEPSAEGSRFYEAESLVAKLGEVNALMGSALAAAQQRQEDLQSARPARPFAVGDKVWLDIRNLRTWRPSQKLDWKHQKFTVLAVPSPLNVRLDTPPGIHPVFHVDLIEKAADDPFPSQRNPTEEPPPIVGDDGAETWEVEEILQAKGPANKRLARVKWVGYDDPTWEPIDGLLDTEAMDRWEAKFGSILTSNGGKTKRKKRS